MLILVASLNAAINQLEMDINQVADEGAEPNLETELYSIPQ